MFLKYESGKYEIVIKINNRYIYCINHYHEVDFSNIFGFNILMQILLQIVLNAV